LGLFVDVCLGNCHALEVGRKDRLVVHVPLADQPDFLPLAIEQGELAGVDLKDLGDHPGSLDRVVRELRACRKWSQE
jgi:hypothetical protein